MGIENVVIAYRADINDIVRKVKRIQRINQIAGKAIGKDLGAGFKIVSQQLDKISSGKPITLKTGEVTRQVKRFTTVLKDANGKLFTVRESVAGTGKNIKIFNRTVSAGANVTRSFGQNLVTLAKRAALTIPLWFALRRGIGAVFTTIRDGLKAIVDFDQALQKARRNLQGSASEIEINFGTLRKEITQLSLETGRSVEEITNAFQKFATVGFDFETSLAGANSATKTAILLFGDATDTANAFARTMRVLVDESKDAKPASEQLSEVMALTVELWKENAFELNEFTAGLERFAPIAKTAGFSAGEATKLIATLGTAALRGSKAGRLLGTSIVRLVTKTDELASSLGIKVNPELDRTFDIFLKVIDALEKTKSATGKVSPEFERLVKSLFGLRSGLAVKGLIALNKELKKNLAVTGDIARFNKEFEEVNKTIFQLAAQFKNLNKEIGKAFVVGLVGGENFRDSLEEIVEFQSKIIKQAQALGKALTLSGQITFGFTGGAAEVIVDELNQSLIDRIIGTKEAKDELKKVQDEILKNNDKLLKGLEGQLQRVDLKRLIVEIDTDIKLDTGTFTIDRSLLIKSKKALEEQLEDLEPIEPNITIKVDQIEITNPQQNKLIKALIKDQLERLRLQGATESQLLKIEDRLIRQTDINDDIIAQKLRQLEIDRKITEEQKARTQFSSESVKLAEIAKNEGVATARAISEVLSGQRDFNTFLKQGGDRAEILKNEFAEFVKNQQLLKFFLGRGAGIQIQENIGQRDFSPIRGQLGFELAKSRIGLKESTDRNNIAIIKNTATMEELIKRFQGFGTVTGREVLEARGQANQISRLINIQAIQQRVVSQTITPSEISQVRRTGVTDTINLNIDIEGRNINLTGTPSEIRALAENISPQVISVIERALAFKLQNEPQSPISKGTSTAIRRE